MSEGGSDLVSELTIRARRTAAQQSRALHALCECKPRPLMGQAVLMCVHLFQASPSTHKHADHQHPTLLRMTLLSTLTSWRPTSSASGAMAARPDGHTSTWRHVHEETCSDCCQC